MLGVWSDATDGYDSSYDQRLTPTGGDGYAGVFHEYGAGGWTGPTGFYMNDMRGRPEPDQAKTWEPIYVWADPNYTAPTMHLAILANEFMPAPTNREYRLRLLGVPKGVDGAPAVGTTWLVPTAGEFQITLPTYSTRDGLEGYRLAFTVSAVVPEPGAAAWLAGLGLLAARRR